MLIALLACRVDPVPPDQTDTSDSAATCDLAEPTPPEKVIGADPRLARTLTGSATWSVDFDADAEALGYTDCSYVRDYGELIERTDQAYLCPACTLIVQGEATVIEGFEDCYAQISDAEAERVEQLGLVEGDTASFWRSGSENTRLVELGAWSDGAVSWSDVGELEVGTFVLTGQGSFVMGESDVLVEDPAGAITTPYACGWPMQSPGGLPESWEATVGSVFPNARLEDTCGERVDIWDFRGRYLVVDASSPNCGPCQVMAEQSEAFKAQMAEACVPVEMLTLLNAGLSEVNLPASGLVLTDWAITFGLSSPVLADEGFGYAIMAPALNPEGGMSLPTIAVLNPEGEVIWLDSGFGEASGYFEPIRAVIEADWAARG